MYHCSKCLKYEDCDKLIFILMFFSIKIGDYVVQFTMCLSDPLSIRQTVMHFNSYTIDARIIKPICKIPPCIQMFEIKIVKNAF